MAPSLLSKAVLVCFVLTTSINAQATIAAFVVSTTVSASASTASEDVYTGYNLEYTGDSNSTVYDTASTASNATILTGPPDVFLNATVSVGEISLLVSNLTAKVTLDAQVLSLLTFTAGVTASIDRVSLLIQNISAHVLLEARLENLVTMISDVLDSIDLNPIIATLSADLGDIVDTTTSAVTSTLTKRSLNYELENNILYSINDYAGNTHTNRVLSQDGNLVDQKLDNHGTVSSEVVVGRYNADMTFNGFNKTVVRGGESVNELEYVYAPFPGLSVVSAVYVDGEGGVVGTQVLSESSAGGSSTIGRDV